MLYSSEANRRQLREDAILASEQSLSLDMPFREGAIRHELPSRVSHQLPFEEGRIKNDEFGNSLVSESQDCLYVNKVRYPGLVQGCYVYLHNCSEGRILIETHSQNEIVLYLREGSNNRALSNCLVFDNQS